MYSIKMKSWHMWLANFGVEKWKKLETADRIDICRYGRRVLLGAMKLAALTIAVTGVTWWAVYSIGNMIGWLFLDYVLIEPTVMFFSMAFALTALVAIGGVWHGYKWIRDRRAINRPVTEPGFVSLMAHKIKSKMCFMIEVK